MNSTLKTWLKDWLARSVWAYGPNDVVRYLRRIGVGEGSTLMMHASWRPHNGFQGKPAALVEALKTVVGPDGLVVMMSLPYQNMSSAEWLATGKPMNVKRSPSMMGMVSEVFRRSAGVRRSLNATHPILAWGRDAESFLADHEKTEFPCGPESPFPRLLARDAMVIGFDAPYYTFTFHMLAEHLLADTLPVPLYAPEVLTGTIIDYDGNEIRQPIRVFSTEANRQRRLDRLISRLADDGALHRDKLGNTALTWIRAQAMMDGAVRLAREGPHFYDAP